MEKSVRTIEPEHDERPSWAELIGDHDRIAGMCVALVAVAEGPVTERARASDMLVELAILVADHLGVENELVDMTALAMAANCTEGAIVDMRTSLAMLKGDWKQFIAHWLPTIPAAEWSQFGADARAILDRLRDQVDDENRLIYEAALRHGVIDAGRFAVH